MIGNDQSDLKIPPENDSEQGKSQTYTNVSVHRTESPTKCSDKTQEKKHNHPESISISTQPTVERLEPNESPSDSSISSPPPNPPNSDNTPQFDSLDEEIVFIDDSPDEVKNGDTSHCANERKNTSNCALNLDISPEEYYKWFDAHGTSQQAEEPRVPLTVHADEEYSNYLASEYFDARGSRTMTPASGKSYEDIDIPPENIPRPSSTKAREWVKSFNEDASKRAEKILMEEAKKKQDMQECKQGEQKQEQRERERELENQEREKQQQQHLEMPNLPRSKSEIQLSNVKVKRSKKDEIVLNAENPQSNSGSKRLLQKLFHKENKPANNKTLQSSTNSAEVDRKESIKKIFNIKGKLAVKTPILDPKLFTDKETDIHLASMPYALTNIANKQSTEKEQVSKTSIKSNKSGILETELKPEKRKEPSNSNEMLDDSEELLKEIEKYLGDAENVQTKTKNPPIPNKDNLVTKTPNTEEIQEQKALVCERKNEPTLPNDNKIAQNVAASSQGENNFTKESENTPTISPSKKASCNHSSAQISTEPISTNPFSSSFEETTNLNKSKLDLLACKANSQATTSLDQPNASKTEPEPYINSDIKTESGEISKSNVIKKLGEKQEACSKVQRNNSLNNNSESKRNSAIGIITEFTKSGARNIFSELKRNNPLNANHESKRHSINVSSVNEVEGQKNEASNSGNLEKSPPEIAKPNLEENVKEKTIIHEDKKKQKPAVYLSKTFKNIKGNVLPKEFKGKLKLKEEKKKMKKLLSPLLPGTRKNSEHEVPDNGCHTIVPGSYQSSKNLYAGITSPTEVDNNKQDITSDKATRTDRESSLTRTFLENFGKSVPENDKDISFTEEEEADISDEELLAIYKQQNKNEKKELKLEESKSSSSEPITKGELENVIKPEQEIAKDDINIPIQPERRISLSSEKEEGKLRLQIESKEPENDKTTNEILREVKENENVKEKENLVTESYAKIKKKETNEDDLASKNETMKCIDMPVSESNKANNTNNEENIPREDLQNQLKPVGNEEVKREVDELDNLPIYENQVKDCHSLCENLSVNSSQITEPSACQKLTNSIIDNQKFENDESFPAVKSKDDYRVKNDEAEALRGVPAFANRPKPLPRTRKSKCGQLRLSDLPSKEFLNREIEKATLFEENASQHKQSQEKESTLNEEIHEKILADNLEAAKTSNESVKQKPQRELNIDKRNIKDSGHDNNTKDKLNGANDPIYWEIKDSPKSTSTPKAESRKGKISQSTQDVSTSSKGSLTKIPDWIQQRPPIPSPRTKKTKSTQSLVQGPLLSSGVDIPNVKVFGASFTNLNFEEPMERGESKWAGEDFYSGKAASIAYGVTSARKQLSEEVDVAPPTLPPRSKKTSMTSLPGSILVEEPCILGQSKELDRFPKFFGKDLAQKRLRRRTSPADVPPKAAPRRIVKPPQLTPSQVSTILFLRNWNDDCSQHKIVIAVKKLSVL